MAKTNALQQTQKTEALTSQEQIVWDKVMKQIKQDTCIYMHLPMFIVNESKGILN